MLKIPNLQQEHGRWVVIESERERIERGIRILARDRGVGIEREMHNVGIRLDSNLFSLDNFKIGHIHGVSGYVNWPVCASLKRLLHKCRSGPDLIDESEVAFKDCRNHRCLPHEVADQPAARGQGGLRCQALSDSVNGQMQEHSMLREIQGAAVAHPETWIPASRLWKERGAAYVPTRGFQGLVRIARIEAQTGSVRTESGHAHLFQTSWSVLPGLLRPHVSGILNS